MNMNDVNVPVEDYQAGILIFQISWDLFLQVREESCAMLGL